MNVDPTRSDGESLRAARDELVAGPLRRAELRAALADLFDGWLTDALGAERGVALVAVGGYGRRELAPGSDLDVVLLHAGRNDVKELAEKIWYPIWDSGIKLDHSVRTVDEAAGVAREDLKAMLGLLDVRHVAGDEELSASLRAQVLTAWRRDARRRLSDVRAAALDRAEKYGELAFLLEPDLKESRGGLRDVHAMHAAAAAWIVDAPSDDVKGAASRLMDVRGELHRRSSRSGDRLVLQEQSAVAAALSYDDADALMRDVYDAARTIAFAADEMWRRADTALRPPRRWRQRPPTRRPLAFGVVEQDGEVMLARDAEPARDPVLVLRAAAAAAQAGLPLSRHTLDRLAEQSAPLPEPWPWAAKDALLSLLGSGPDLVAVWEALDQRGIVVRLLPEWAAVRCHPQRNAVHRFTVDRHLVEAVVEASALTRRVSRPDLLLLGALFHDIGKGYPGDHTDVGVALLPDIGARLGLRPADTDLLATLVRHHLLLPDTATRRDLDDPATVRLVADAVGDRTTLELLHALTVADARATGPAAWGDWKARLVDDLVARATAVLAGTAPPADDLLDASLRDLVRAGVLDVHVDGDRVTVVAPDRPGLLWRWAGALALHRLQIRSATATSVDGMAVTVFDVSPRFGSLPDWSVVRADLRRMYDDASSLSAALAERDRAYARASTLEPAPARVIWADDASESATVVEVRAHDAVGLLYRLTAALAEGGLDVRSARMSTLGAEVVDAFYVVDASGRKVEDPLQRQRIEDLLVTACRRPA
ncbi:MAG: [protein-PII] uridylyltransferase [Frankiaceae bacterium]|nr:[protein-PII] uridylyltransferase [Frankiaceae bacterium]